MHAVLLCVWFYKALFGDRPSRRNLLSKGRTEASSAVQRQTDSMSNAVAIPSGFHRDVFFCDDITRYYIVYYEHNLIDTNQAFTGRHHI